MFKLRKIEPVYRSGSLFKAVSPPPEKKTYNPPTAAKLWAFLAGTMNYKHITETFF